MTYKDELHRAGRQSCGCRVCAAGAGLAAEEPTPAQMSMQRRTFLALMGTGAAAAATMRPQRATAQASAPSGTLILEPDWVLGMRDGQPALLREHSVVVEGDRIAEVVEGRIAGSNDRLAMPGQLLMPGLISTHTHVACGSPTRGLIESGGRTYLRPLEILDALDEDDLDAVTAYNLAEILRGGCTTQVEQSVSLKQAKSYVRVARKWGVRGYPGGMTPGWPRLAGVWFRKDDQALQDSIPETLAEIQANLEFALSVNGAENGRILPMMAPHGPETHTPETLRAVAAAALELGNGIHTHLATNPRDSATVKRLWGKNPVHWVEEFGFYDQRFIGAHLTGWDAEDDAAFLAGKPLFTYAHCPTGAGAGSGQARQPFVEALAAGINTTVALDTHSNDMIENMKLALLYGRARHDMLAEGWPVPMHRPTVMDMVKSVTLNAANGLGRDDLGRIEAGAKADMTSIDVTGFLVGAGGFTPEPLNNLLYAHGLSVRNVMTDGRLQVSDGRLVVDDEQQVVQRGAAAVQKVWDQLATEGWF